MSGAPAAGPEPAGRAGGETAPRLSVVLVHYRTPEFLEQALGALRENPPAVPHEIIVVDNGPKEDGAAEICRRHPLCRYHHPGKNLGYARGVNLGISLSAAPFVLVMNPDVSAEPGSIDRLLDVMEKNPSVGIAGPKLLYPDQTLQHSARTFYTMRTLLLRRTFLGKIFPNHRVLREHLMLDWDHRGVRDVDWLIGASLLIRREMVEDVGGMDERFFLYFEDVDWCYRAHQRGWKVLYVGDAVMIHHYRRDSARTGTGVRRHLDSLLRYYEKWSLILYILKQRAPQIRTLATLVTDAVMWALAFLAAYGIRKAVEGIFETPVYDVADYIRLFVFGGVVALLVFAGFGLYGSRVWFDRFHGWWQLLKATASVSLVIMASTFLMALGRSYSRIMVVIHFPLSLLLVGLGRDALRKLVRSVKGQGLQLKRLLVVGSAAELDGFRERVARMGPYGFEPVTLLTDSLSRHPAGRRVDPAEELVRWVERERIGEVALFESHATKDIASGALPRLQEMGVRLQLIPERRALVTPGTQIRGLWGLPLIPLGAVGGGRVRSPAKRIIDLAVSLSGLVLGLPLHLIQLLLLGGRPRIVREERVGRCGRIFRLARYREPTVLTRTLRPLRHYPTLSQVAAGRMSLVGIYPFRRDEWNSLPESDRAQGVDAPAGLTGPWGDDVWSAGEVDDRLIMNRNYVRRWSLEGDLRILFEDRRRGSEKAEDTTSRT